MASNNERFIFSDQTWFDASNPGTLHDALRADHARAKAMVARRPSLRRHMESCSVCQEIEGATVAAPPPGSTRKRLKLVLNKERMHRALRLPDSFEIVHMYADNDPNFVFVLVAGEGLPEVPPDDETMIGVLDDATEDTSNRTS